MPLRRAGERILYWMFQILALVTQSAPGEPRPRMQRTVASFQLVIA
jgi:hypothetical protein